MNFKKITALVISAVMVLGLCTFPVFADEVAFDPFAGDHIPEALTDNLLQKPNNVYVVDMAANIDKKADAIANQTRYLTKTSDFTANLSGWSRGLAGLQYIGNSPTQGFSADLTIEGQDTVVFSYALRNYGTTDSFVWNAALANTTWSFSGRYPVEYGADGFVVSDKENWVEFKGTCQMPGSAGTQYRPTLMVGFMNAAAGSSAEVNYGSQASLPYVALEKAHDLVFEATKGDLIVKGIDSEFSVKLVNQVDSTGYLTQPEFAFSVFGADGNAVDGISVVNNGGVATVSAADTVADGTYYIRVTADIDEETTWQKTLAVKVAGKIENTEDHVVGAKPANLVNSASYHSNSNSSIGYTGQYLPSEVTNGEDVTAFVNSLSESLTFDHNMKQSEGNYYGVNGIIIKFLDTTAHPKTNTTYVVSAKVRSTTGGHKMNVTHIHSYNKLYTTYAYGLEGYEINGTDWQDFKAVLTTTPNGGVAEKKGSMLLGLYHAPANSYLLVRQIPGLYVAEEMAYDIKVTGDTSEVNVGGEMTLSASVENQIGTEGTLAQTFDWVAVNEDRTVVIDGITFEESNGGADVTVNVADDVAAGNYLIVAQSEEYGMNRQYPIRVTAPTYDVTELTLNTDSSSAVLESLSVNTDKNVKVIIAAFKGNKVTNAMETLVTSVDGVATLTDALALFELSSGDNVRVFVWDEKFSPFTMKNEWKLPVVIK